jgi:polyhydroxyalkanoate synthesis regulator protein
MQLLVPRYLETSLSHFTQEQEKFREQMGKTFNVPGFGAFDDQVKRNMEMFQRAFTMFLPTAKENVANPPAETGGDDIDALKRQVSEMQKKLDKIGE